MPSAQTYEVPLRQNTAPESAGQSTGPASVGESFVDASPEELPEDDPEELPDDDPEELPEDEPDELPVSSVVSSVVSAPESPPGPPVLELLPPQPTTFAETVHPVRPPMTIHVFNEFELRMWILPLRVVRRCRPPGGNCC
jgi:hypothetical protein